MNKNLIIGESADIKITATNKIKIKSRIRYRSQRVNIKIVIKIIVLCEISIFLGIYIFA